MRKLLMSGWPLTDSILKVDFESELASLRRKMVVRQGCRSVVPRGTFLDLASLDLAAHQWRNAISQHAAGLDENQVRKVASTDRHERPPVKLPGHVCAEARYPLTGFIDNLHFADAI
jgi:hypothetical protein